MAAPLLPKLIRRTFAALFIVTVTIYFVWAFGARQMLDLGPEHRLEFDNEFEVSQEASTDWQRYVAIEQELADELARAVEIHTRTGSLIDRHNVRGLTNARNVDAMLNRSYERSAASPRGVAVLLHGLSDSPYSMLTTAETLVDAGFNVVAPRLPGHGYAVGGLKHANWEDWTAVVRIAVARAIDSVGDELPLILVGYSNGGLLAIDYALRCEQYANLVCPARIVLMSPAIALSRAAMVTNMHSLVSWLPFFEKFQWLSILPEVDPYKFTSFPKRAAWEVYQVSTRMHRELADPSEADKLPPILTFQSVVDNTVSAGAVAKRLSNI